MNTETNNGWRGPFPWASAVPRWISVRDRLPEMDGKTKYLVHFDGYVDNPENNGIDVYVADGQSFWFWFQQGLPYGITHYMPITEPPKEGA